MIEGEAEKDHLFSISSIPHWSIIRGRRVNSEILNTSIICADKEKGNEEGCEGQRKREIRALSRVKGGRLTDRFRGCRSCWLPFLKLSNTVDAWYVTSLQSSSPLSRFQTRGWSASGEEETKRKERKETLQLWSQKTEREHICVCLYAFRGNWINQNGNYRCARRYWPERESRRISLLALVDGRFEKPCSGIAIGWPDSGGVVRVIIFSTKATRHRPQSEINSLRSVAAIYFTCSTYRYRVNIYIYMVYGILNRV